MQNFRKILWAIFEQKCCLSYGRTGSDNFIEAFPPEDGVPKNWYDLTCLVSVMNEMISDEKSYISKTIVVWQVFSMKKLLEFLSKKLFEYQFTYICLAQLN